jgi:hypothetical protein
MIPSPDVGRFLARHVMVLFLFLVAILFSTVAIFPSSGSAKLMLALGTAAHWLVFVLGCCRHKLGSYSAISLVLSTLFVLLLNDHRSGDPELGAIPLFDPFAIFDYQAYGLITYLRVFDDSSGVFGASFWDSGAFVLNLELALGMSILVLFVCWFCGLLCPRTEGGSAEGNKSDSNFR